MLICEDSIEGNMLRGFTRDGLLFGFALNAISGGTDEFAGATFSPDAQVLYANMQ